MAGFGFGNVTKEGPGVPKDAPKKRRFFLFWELYFRKFWNLMLLNFLYIACCLPIVTIGAATAGFTYVLRNYINEKPVFLKEDFFEAFKKNWKQESLVFLLNLLFFGIAVFAAYFYYQVYNANQQIVYFIGMVVVLSAIVVALFMNFYLHLMIVTFDFPLKKLLKNAFIFAGLGVRQNLLSLVWFILLGTGLYFLFMFSPLVAGALGILLVLPFCGMVVCFNVFPLIRKHIIDPYYKKNDLPNPLDRPSGIQSSDSGGAEV